ncbi:MAG: bifunctional diaminohydroxyphosphoribosylaminopyrimidine deaminase/5-amino-6-(5-phosphoribosylamino)uracil reductase RibD, partial [Bacilli bacterium]
NEVFNKYITESLPFVTLKAAMTLDGKIGTVTGDSRWVSGELSRAEVHRYRHEHQAIMIGIGTVIADNPQMTTRMEVEGRNPTRIVVDSMLRIPLDAKVVQDHQAKTIIVTTNSCDPNKKLALLNKGVEVIEVNEGIQVDLDLAMLIIAKKEISSVLVEGGATLAGAMMERQLVDKFILYIAPKIVGGDEAPSVLKMKGIPYMNKAITFNNIGYEQVGNDMRFIGYPTYAVKKLEWGGE